MSWDTEVGFKHLEIGESHSIEGLTLAKAHRWELKRHQVLIQDIPHFHVPADLIILLKMRFLGLIPTGSDLVGLGCGLKICTTNKFPGGADGPQTTHGVSVT